MTDTGAKRLAVLDTDIGTDVDDILALTLLARAPEVELLGVTTVYGDTELRARMVRRVLDPLGRSDVPIGIGARETLTNRPIFWAGHEGEGIPDLSGIAVDPGVTAADLLRQAAEAHRGELELFAIGPLTNVARAIEDDPAFSSSLRHLTIMGGAFWLEKAEHNITCDPEAAEVVFRSGIPMTVVGLDVTLQVRLREADLPAIREAVGGIGPLLAGQIERWWAFVGKKENYLHDPLAVLAALRPELFRWETCEVRVELEEPHLGWTRPERCGEGAIRIAADVQVEAAEREMIGRIAG